MHSPQMIADLLYQPRRNGTRAFSELCRRRGFPQDYMSPPQVQFGPEHGSAQEQCAVFNDWLETQGWPRVYGTVQDTQSSAYWRWRHDHIKRLETAWKHAGYSVMGAEVDLERYYPNGVENTISMTQWPQSVIPRRGPSGHIDVHGMTTTVESEFTAVNRLRTVFGEDPMLLPEYVSLLRRHGWVVFEQMPPTARGTRTVKKSIPDALTTLRNVAALTSQAAPVFHLVHFLYLRGVLVTLNGVHNGQYFWDGHFGAIEDTQQAPLPRRLIYPTFLTLVEMGVLLLPRNTAPSAREDAVWEFASPYQISWPPELPQWEARRS